MSAKEVPLNTEIQQVVHGYADGHRLLAGSLELAPDVAHLVLRMSDLSGSNVVSGFENYLTVYPLSKVSAYAIAKTWYAPEMPRPGCVWTQTLILSNTLAGSLDSLADVIGIFSRPDIKKGLDDYKRSLQLPTKIFKSKRSEAGPFPAEIGEIVECLYGPEHRSLVLEAKNSEEWQKLMVTLWDFQWPALRTSFSFCTGSLSARNIDGQPLDVQVAPSQQAREVSRGPVIKTSGQTYGTQLKYPKWVKLIIEELKHPLVSAFRNFLLFVAEGEIHRSSLWRYAYIYQLLTQRKFESSVRQLVESIAEFYPSSGESVKLKKLLFGGNAPKEFGPHLGEKELLGALATTKGYQAYCGTDLQLQKRGKSIWKHDVEGSRLLLGELFRSDLNPFGEKILRGLISGMETSDAILLAESEPHLLSAALRINPKLAISSKLWQGSGRTQLALFDAIASAEDQPSAEVTSGILQALLEANAYSVAERVLDRFTTEGVDLLLRWIGSDRQPFHEAWKFALSAYPQTILNWLDQNSVVSNRLLNFVSSILNACDPVVLRHGTTTWFRLIEGARLNKGDSNVIEFRSFLMSLSLGNPRPAADQLAGFAFESVHFALSNKALAYEVWQMLAQRLPDIGWNLWWDHCERLRRGTIEAFVQYGWPAASLLEYSSNPEIIHALKKSARHVEGGEKLWDRVVESSDVRPHKKKKK